MRKYNRTRSRKGKQQNNKVAMSKRRECCTREKVVQMGGEMIIRKIEEKGNWHGIMLTMSKWID
jgi:hypothetical protein